MVTCKTAFWIEHSKVFAPRYYHGQYISHCCSHHSYYLLRSLSAFVWSPLLLTRWLLWWVASWNNGNNEMVRRLRCNNGKAGHRQTTIYHYTIPTRTHSDPVTILASHTQLGSQDSAYDFARGLGGPDTLSSHGQLHPARDFPRGQAQKESMLKVVNEWSGNPLRNNVGVRSWCIGSEAGSKQLFMYYVYISIYIYIYIHVHISLSLSHSLSLYTYICIYIYI